MAIFKLSQCLAALAVLSLAFVVLAQPDVVTLTGGYDDILSRAATLNPSSMAFSGSGDLLFTDRNTVRLISAATGSLASNRVSTLVGSAPGDVTGKVNQLLTTPSNLVYDPYSTNQLRSRYWFLETSLTNKVRILDVDYANEPFITTVPVAGSFIGIAPDYNNGAFAISTGSSTVSRITTAGVVTNFATGLPSNPLQIATSATQTVYMDSNTVYLYNTGTSTFQAVGALTGVTGFLTSDGTTVYLAQILSATSVALKNMAGTTVLTVTGLPARAISSVAFASSKLYISYGSMHGQDFGLIVRGNALENVISLVPPRSSSAAIPAVQARLASVGSLSVDGNNGIVLIGSYGAMDLYNAVAKTVQNVFGNYIGDGSVVNGILSVARARYITGIAAHTANQAYYFADSSVTSPVSSLRVLRLDQAGVYTSGNVSTLIGDSATLGAIRGLALDRSTKSIVFTTSTRMVYRYYLETAVLSAFAGNSSEAAIDRDGVGQQALFVSLGGIAVSPLTGYIYVADTGANKVKRIDPDSGSVLSFAGDGSSGSSNGLGTTAQISAPVDVEAAANGFVYASSGFVIRGINENTTEVFTAAGSTAGSVDDLLLRAKMATPTVMAVDNYYGTGNVVYFYDSPTSFLRRAVMIDVCPSTVCNDFNLCTTDTCVSALQGCQFVNNNNPCDDGKACTTGDSCSNGVCVSASTAATGSPCFNGNLCMANQLCNASSVCVGTPVVCNDENLCTIDSCDPARGCVFTQISCDDNNPCTRDTCISNIGCVNTPITGPCDLDNNPCTVDMCSATGNCTYTGPNACDDGNPCTVDSCDPTAGCLHADPAPCVGQNFVKTSTCSCACDLNKANAGCPVPADTLQCLCLIPNSGPFFRLEVHYNGTYGDRAQFATAAERDVYLRNQMAFLTLIPEISLTIIYADDNGISGSRRLILDVYGSGNLAVADVLSRFASASECNLLPPACIPTDNSLFGGIEIFYLNPVVSAAPVFPTQRIPSLPPDIGTFGTDRSVVEARSYSYDVIQSIPIESANSMASAIAAPIATLLCVFLFAALLGL